MRQSISKAGTFLAWVSALSSTCAIAHAATPVAARAVTPATSASAPTRLDALSQFKTQCPSKVTRLLNAAMSNKLLEKEAIDSVCACSGARLEASPAETPIDDLPQLAASAVLACSKPVITAYNRAWTHEQFSTYLSQQGWTPAQQTQFEDCIVDAHWTGQFETGLQGRRAGGMTGPALWKRCTAQAGQPGTPLPFAAAPAKASVNSPAASSASDSAPSSKPQ